MSFFIRENGLKKTISIILIILLLAPILFLGAPKESDAQVLPVAEVGHSGIANWLTSIATHIGAAASTVTASLTGALSAKTFVGDPIAYFIAKQIIRQLTAQTVKWINSGFKGNPAYVTNTDQFFLNIGDSVASRILSTNGVLSQLCSPFRAQVRLALVKNYLNDNQNFSCTLGRLEQNLTSFTNDFSQGGWDGWFAMTQTSLNNPYGSYLQGADQISLQTNAQIGKYQTQLNQGRGFLSYAKCVNPNENAANTLQLSGTGSISTAGGSTNGSKRAICLNPPSQVVTASCISSENQMYQNGRWVNLDSNAGTDAGANGDLTDCAQTEIVTPGSVIENQLENVLGSPIKQLELANSINQVVSALLTEMVSQVIGGIGNGLRGLSETNSTQTTAFIDRLASTSPEVKAENASFISGVYQAAPPELNPNNSIPAITLNGNPNIDIPLGGQFTDPGATATDANDGDITSKIVISGDTVDTNTAGTYGIRYNVTNSQGIDAALVIRTVNVVPPPPPPPPSPLPLCILLTAYCKDNPGDPSCYPPFCLN